MLINDNLCDADPVQQASRFHLNSRDDGTRAHPGYSFYALYSEWRSFSCLYDRDLHGSADGLLDRMTALQTWQKRQILISASFGMDEKCN